MEGTRSRAIRGSTSDDRVGVQRTPRVDYASRRVRSLRVCPVFRISAHARSRVPMVLDPFHYWTSANVLGRTRLETDLEHAMLNNTDK